MPTPSQAPATDTAATVPLITSTEGPAVPEIRSNQEIGLSSQVLLFAFAVIIVESVVIKMLNMDSASAVRLLTVTLILASTLYLTTAGYNSPQIATSTGLLGTIAGYLLGRSNESPAK